MGIAILRVRRSWKYNWNDIRSQWSYVKIWFVGSMNRNIFFYVVCVPRPKDGGRQMQIKMIIHLQNTAW